MQGFDYNCLISNDCLYNHVLLYHGIFHKQTLYDKLMNNGMCQTHTWCVCVCVCLCQSFTVPSPSRITCSWRWTYDNPLKCWELLNNTQSSQRLESLATLLREPQISNYKCFDGCTNVHKTNCFQIYMYICQDGLQVMTEVTFICHSYKQNYINVQHKGP